MTVQGGDSSGGLVPTLPDPGSLSAPTELAQNDRRALAALLAAGYVRLLAQRTATIAGSPPPLNTEKRLDSRRPKSVNVLDDNGDADA